jgi:hypothetical protein
MTIRELLAKLAEYPPDATVRLLTVGPNAFWEHDVFKMRMDTVEDDRLNIFINPRVREELLQKVGEEKLPV